MNEKKRRLLQLVLLILTFVTTTFAGMEWSISKSPLFSGGITWDDFLWGMNYSIPLLLILSVHEFGHYFTARYHKIKVSLPYYIPFWLGGFPSIGTFGAVIRIRETIQSRTKYFDVGVSGPVAGFAVAIGVLWYGYATLPETNFIYQIHPEYQVLGDDFEQKLDELDTVIYKEDVNSGGYTFRMERDSVVIGQGSFSIYFGDNLLMMAGREFLAPDDRYVPGPHEIMHYPWLMAGYIAFLFTALNLLPIGQLDGGHVTFGLFGEKWHHRISKVVFITLLFFSGLGWVKMQNAVNSSGEEMLGFIFQLAVYLYVVFLCTRDLFRDKRDRWMFAAVLMAVQFVLSSFLGWEGYPGGMLFAILLGFFVGIKHPPVEENETLTRNRKILGWLALIIFVLCFTPVPVQMSGV